MATIRKTIDDVPEPVWPYEDRFGDVTTWKRVTHLCKNGMASHEKETHDRKISANLSSVIFASIRFDVRSTDMFGMCDVYS